MCYRSCSSNLCLAPFLLICLLIGGDPNPDANGVSLNQHRLPHHESAPEDQRHQLQPEVNGSILQPPAWRGHRRLRIREWFRSRVVFYTYSRLTLSGPQSRFGDKSLGIRLVYPRIGTAVLKEMKQQLTGACPFSALTLRAVLKRPGDAICGPQGFRSSVILRHFFFPSFVQFIPDAV